MRLPSLSPLLRPLLLSGLLGACVHPSGGAPPPSAPPTAAPRRVHVRVLGINDFHGNLSPPQGSSGEVRAGVGPDGKPQRVKAGGMNALARHLATLRAERPQNTIVVSAGDLIGASPLVSALFHDEPTIEAMNLAGLEFSAVGNHEFDEGRARAAAHAGRAAATRWMAARRTGPSRARSSSSSPPTWWTQGHTLFPPYAVREFEGVKVAFIGMTLEGTPEHRQRRRASGAHSSATRRTRSTRWCPS